jgi:hypothetical protein
MSGANVFEIRPGASAEKIGTIKDASATIGFAPDEPSMLSAVNAILPVLPAPLALTHGPLIVTIETWSDGSVVARLPCAALYGSGDSDTAALEDLGIVISDFIGSMRGLVGADKAIAGPLKRDWENVSALVDMSQLPS